MSRKCAAVIDANSLIARSIFATALDDLRAGGQFTGGIFGALGSLRSIMGSPWMADVGPIFAFFDCGVPKHRMRLLPDYKQARREGKEMLTEEQRARALSQIDRCYELWPTLGVHCLCYRNREADDGVAAAVRILLKQKVKPIVLSSDRDLWQTIAWGADVFDLRTQQLITIENFEEHSEGIPIDAWLLYKAIIGDTSDGIKGAPGCGPKRARELLSAAVTGHMERPGTNALHQLRYLCAVTRESVRTAKKPRAFEQSLLDNEMHLRRVLKAIDLRDSFGPTRKLAKRMTELPPVRQRDFLIACRDLKFASILGDPSGTLDPFKEAASRR